MPATMNSFFRFLLVVSCMTLLSCAADRATMIEESPEPEAAAAPQEVKEMQATAVGDLPEGWQEFESGAVYFKKGSYDLDSTAKEFLTLKAEWLYDHPQINIVIQGYSDEPGTVEYNLALGDRRAGSVKTYLIQMGIGPARLAAVSYGNQLPTVTAAGQGTRDKNRRVQLVIEKLN